MKRVCASVFLGLFAAAAWSKVVLVNANAPGPVHDGASWATALTTISAAKGIAVSGDEVWVAASPPASPAYTENVNLGNGVSLYGGFAGTETARDQRNARANPTIIEPPNPAPGVTLASATLDGFTIRNAPIEAVSVVGPAAISHNVLTNNGRQSQIGYQYFGGGVYVAAGPVTIANNVICDNRADKGAAVFSEKGTLTLTNNVMCANAARVAGGAMFVREGTLTFVNNTITGNTSPIAAVYIPGSSNSTFINNLVAGNSGGIYPYYQPAVFRNNDVWDNGAFNYKGVSDPTGAAGNISQDPLLSSLYRSPHLQPGSPCINAGSSTDDPGAEDIDGQTRVQGGRVDIGADEWDGSTTPVNPAVIRVSPAGDDANDGSSWENAKRTLSAALAAAQPDDEVWAAGGTYRERITVPAGVALYGGFAGDEATRVQRHWAEHRTVLDGRFTGTAVVTMPAAGATLDGVTIRNASGPGILCDPGHGTIRHVTVRCGLSEGIKLGGSGAAVSNSAVLGNRGVGIYAETGAVSLNSVTIAGNESIGVYSRNNNLTVRNCIVASNGSGISVYPGWSTLRYNDVYGNVNGNYSNISNPTGSNGNISADPLIADLRRDFRLKPGSPCIDKGGEAEGDADLDGQPRLQGSRVDMGADESDGSMPQTPAPRIVRVSPDGDDANDGAAWTSAKRTIAAAVADADYGDEAWVAAGTFRESVWLPMGVSLYGGFAGAETTRDQRSNDSGLATLDGGRDGSTDASYHPSVVTGPMGNTVDGFTILNGWGGVNVYSGIVSHNAISGHAGSGVTTYGASTVERNVISGNAAYNGAGISAGQGKADIARNVIVDNTATGWGGGVLVNAYCTATLANNLIARNQSVDQNGGGVYIRGETSTLINNTLAENTSRYSGGAVCAQTDTVDVTLDNNILAGNSSGIYFQILGTATLRHNDVWNNGGANYDGVADPTGKDGNLSADPAFAGPGNWRLTSGSPCIDAGDSALAKGTLDLDGRPRNLGASVDMGAYETSPGAPAFTMADAVAALRIAGGLTLASAPDARLNVDGAAAISLADALRLLRLAARLDE